jgi:hypothetical protein
LEENMKLADARTWKTAQGKEELLKHLRGEMLTYREIVLALCYSCTLGYFDGKRDCQMPECPCHQAMPFRTVKLRRGRILTDGERADIGKRLNAHRKTGAGTL